MSRFLAATMFAFVGLTMTTACGGGGGGGSDANAEAVAEANKVWNERCVTCHGNDGSGNGPGAAALAVKPRSFKDPTWQASVDDARIKKVIVEGGKSVGLNEAMAPNPDLQGKDAVLSELVTKIRKQVQ
ncbi:MAG: cytochrome c [Myxococcales bacterium]|nr:cytochrome c [Myxococcales bacterium]